jgi:kynureninase
LAFADTLTEFVPRPGAAGYQVSNPSALDLSAVVASLEIFGQTSMSELCRKSESLTKYLEKLLLESPESKHKRPFTILTSSNADERGAQLSLRLEPGLLDSVLHSLEENGVIVDERKPDVIRVAPAPLYNTYLDVWNFVQVFFKACQRAVGESVASVNGAGSLSDDGTGATFVTEAVHPEDQSREAKGYGLNAK